MSAWADKYVPSSRSRAGRFNAVCYVLFLPSPFISPLPNGEGVTLQSNAEGSTEMLTATVPSFVLYATPIESGDELCPLKSSSSSRSSSSFYEAYLNGPLNTSFPSVSHSLKERLHNQPDIIYQYEYERLMNLLSSSPRGLNESKNSKKNDGSA